MPKPPSRHSGRSDRDRHPDKDDRDRHSGEGEQERHSREHGEHEFEHDEGNRAHIEIEARRFRGGLPPTPELYERAREQWNQLPGAVERSTDPAKSEPPVESEAKPAGEVVDEDKQEGSR
jgi:hypothetical protein